MMPMLNHTAEFLLHWLLGTANLKGSILLSVCFTILSTGFNLFAMRREVLITGKDSRSFAEDLKKIPGLLISYCWAILGAFRIAFLLVGSIQGKNRRSAHIDGYEGRRADASRSIFGVREKNSDVLPA
jgi:hypothetical protein